MTDHPVQGLAEESSAGFVNGNANPAATAPTVGKNSHGLDDGASR